MLHSLTYSCWPRRNSLGIVVILLLIHKQASVTCSTKTDNHDLFKISWLGPQPSAPSDSGVDDDNTINIVTPQKHHYKCIVPGTKDDANFDTSATNSSTENDETNPIRLLEPLLNNNFCSYKFELFWIYELCHGRYFKQYHEENTKYKPKITQEYYLGQMASGSLKTHEEEFDKLKSDDPNEQTRPTILINGHYKPYVMLNMTDGTKCDLTKKSRIAKILYVCNEEQKHEIYSIKETSTCEYEAIILSPLLCLHKDFKSDTNTPQEIKCYSMDNAPKKPENAIEFDAEDEEEKGNKRRGVIDFQRRTLMIDADFILG